MNITLLYMHVRTKLDPNYVEPFPYEQGAQRFKETYEQFMPKTPHRLVVVNTGVINDASIFTDTADAFESYHGRGWDCGTYQAVARRQDCDLLVCFNTLAYLWRPGWLEPFVHAYEKHGKGVYGPTASYELQPHLRTPCIAFHPSLAEEYPLKVDSRQHCCTFEHGPTNFSLWAKKAGYPVLMVTADGEYEQADWRKPRGIFRKDNQEALLVKDRHTLVWEQAKPEEKAILSRRADGLC